MDFGNNGSANLWILFFELKLFILKNLELIELFIVTSIQCFDIFIAFLFNKLQIDFIRNSELFPHKAVYEIYFNSIFAIRIHGI